MKSSSPQVTARLLAATVKLAVEEVDRATIAKRLSVGSTLGARILESLGAHKYIVGFAGMKMVAESSAELPVGSRIGVQVSSLEPKIHLRILPSDKEGMNHILAKMGFEKPSDEMRAAVSELMNRGEPIERETVRRAADLMKRGVPPREAALLATSELPATERVVEVAKAATGSVADALARVTTALEARGREKLAAEIRESLSFRGDIGALFSEHPLRQERRLLAGPGKQELTAVLQELIRAADAADTRPPWSGAAAELIALLQGSDIELEQLLLPRLKVKSLASFLGETAKQLEARAERGDRDGGAIARQLGELLKGLEDSPLPDESRMLMTSSRRDAKGLLLELAGLGTSSAADKPDRDRARATETAPADSARMADDEVADAARNLVNTLEAHYLLGDPRAHIPFVVEDDGLRDASISAQRFRGRTHVRFSLMTSALGEVVGVVDLEKKAVGISIGVQQAAARKNLLAAAPALETGLRALGLRVDALSVDVIGDSARPAAVTTLKGLDLKV
ncbi:MAG: flagellar hook-length control protein FliK [Candidatus Hydrogenedentota bacterium]